MSIYDNYESVNIKDFTNTEWEYANISILLIEEFSDYVP